MRLALCAVTLVCSLRSARLAGQERPAVTTPRFDVVSIRQNTSPSWQMKMEMHDGTLQVSNLYLKSIITSAYGVREDLISGLPSWARKAKYDITAKMDPSEAVLMNTMTRSARRSMIRDLLDDRFQLKAHTEVKMRPIYELVLSGKTPRFPQHAQDHGDGEAGAPVGVDSVRIGDGQFDATDVKLPILTSFLEETLATNIVDKTGLQEKYDFRLRWTPETEASPSSATEFPSLFTALGDQLGLKLRPAKGLVETLVIDRLSQPSAN